jgi:transposase
MKRRGQEDAPRPERRNFSPEFKAEVVRLAREAQAEGKSVAQLGRELEIRPDLLRVWVKEAAAQRPRGAPEETLEQEVRRLRKEVDTLRQEQAFAKKVAAYFAKESR